MSGTRPTTIETAALALVLAALALVAPRAALGQTLRPAPTLEQAWKTAAGSSDPAEQAALQRARQILSHGGGIKAEDRAFLDAELPKLLAARLIGRAPTAYEKNQIQGWFPKLAAKGDWRVTGEACNAYNCISWSVGIVSSWQWPTSNAAYFDQFYLSYGYVPLAAGEGEAKADVAFWVDANGTATHGCRRVSGDVWESKLGSSLRILHKLHELEGTEYGHVAKLYRRATPDELTRLGVTPMQADATDQDPCAARASAKRNLLAPYDIGSPRSDKP